LTIKDAIRELEKSLKACRFQRLAMICESFFGAPRISGSHHIYKTPWVGDPRLNIQDNKGQAKTYQVRQVIAALKKLDGS
jgi:hypothetical protein